MTEPDFRKTYFPAENAGNMPEKPVFWHFLEISSLVFCIFFAQRCVIAMLKTWPSSIFKENFFRKSPFLQIFIGLFPYIPLFFHTKILFITMPTINHGLIVNKTDFWSRNFLKIAGIADFRRKNGISWISRALLNILSWNLAHWCKMATSKMWSSPIFKKRILPAENAGNMPEKLVFWPFLKISSLVFSNFMHKDAY